MKRILIHSMSIGGHQLEYLHHLYMGALKRPYENYFFLVPKRFEIDSNRLEWPSADNISIEIMKEGEEPPKGCGLFKKGWVNSKTIHKYCKRYNATDVITISIMEYLPFLPFLVRNVRFSGIVYRIYLYEWSSESKMKRLLDAFKYQIMCSFKVFHRVYMCNDSASAACLNRIFKTSKFKMMPDPVASLNNYQGRNIREKLGISNSKKILLHPGGMSDYKNTIGILKALEMIDQETCDSIAVIFAGQIASSIRDEFNALYNKNKTRVQMFLFEGFLPFETLADLFTTCDYVLVPYKVKSQSSGIVGHSAYYRKPVVAIEGGVIGKMVKKWHLGVPLYRSSEVSLYQFLCSLKSAMVYNTKGNTYLESHTIEMFYKTLLDD